MSGFDVLAQLRQRPRIIFITAHDEFAVKAFDEQALDYLLKPVEPERLARALARITEASETDVASGAASGAASAATSDWAPIDAPLDRLLASIGQSKPVLRRIPVRRGARIALVEVSSAAFFRAEDKYTVLYTGDAEHVIDRTIDELEQSLDPEQFLRIHRA